MSKFSSPYFSVILCTNVINDYFFLAVNSILKQTFSDFEFLIIANGDKSLESSFLSFDVRDDRISFYCTNIRQLGFNLNYGINLAKGKYIVRMDADDISCLSRLEKLFSCCASMSPDIVGSWARLIDENNCYVGELKPPTDNISIRRQLPYRNVLIHPSVAIKREVLLHASGYLGDLYAEDYDLWLRLSREKSYVFINLPEYLLEYRIHKDQSKGRRLSYASAAACVYRQFLIKPSLTFFLASVFKFSLFFLYSILRKMK